MDIKQALEYLDPDDESQWTAEGLPRIEAVSGLVGRPVKRQEITDIAPSFTREVAAELPVEDEGAEEDVSDQGDGEGEQDGGVVPSSPKPTGESVMDRPLLEVLRSRELTMAALRELEGKILETSKRKRAIDEELNKLNDQSAILSRQLDRLTKSDPNGAIKDIQDVLQRSRQARAERVKRARSFIEAGTTAKDVAEQLRGVSKLDAAMERRRVLGTKRPPPRIPVTQQQKGG